MSRTQLNNNGRETGNMERLEIYAPIDGVIEEISKLNDSTFNADTIGPGFFVRSSSNSVLAPFEKCQIKSVGAKNNSFVFEKGDFEALINIGNNKKEYLKNSFEFLANTKQDLTKKSKIANINKEVIGENDFYLIFQLNKNQMEGYKITFVKTGEVKTGDLVAFLELETKKYDLIDIRTKFEKNADLIIDSINNLDQIEKAYNCITRFRLVLKDVQNFNQKILSELIDVKEIKLIGNEVQFIIGADASKQANAFNKVLKKRVKQHEKNSKIKISVKEKLMNAIFGIILTSIPATIASGMLLAIVSIMSISGLIKQVSLDYKSNPAKLIVDYDLLTGITYIISNVGMGFIGVFFCWNAVKYLKGNELIGIMLGISLASPWLMGGLSWNLFSIGNMEINVKSYGSSMLIQVTAGIAYVYLDRWIKEWMPEAVDGLFRPALGYATVILIMFLLVAPFLAIIEGGLVSGVGLLQKIPYGISEGIFAFIYFPLLVTGLHIPIQLVVMQALVESPQTYQYFFAFAPLVGAGVATAVIFKTKSKELKTISYGSIAPALFGICEPFIYGIMIPKPKLFFLGMCSLSFSGFLCGILNTASHTLGGGGIMGIFQVVPGGDPIEIGLAALVMVLTFVVPFILTFVVYKEFESNTHYLKKTNKLFLSTVKNFTTDYKNLWKQIEEFQKIISDKEFKKKFKKFNMYLSRISYLEVKLTEITANKEKNRIKVSAFINKLIVKNDFSNIEKQTEKLNTKKFDELYFLKQTEKISLENEANDFFQEISKLQDNLIAEIEEIIESASIDCNYEKLKLLKNNYFNNLHFGEIYFGFMEKNENIFTKKDTLKTIKKEKFVI